MSSNKIDGDDVFRIACSVEEIAQKTAYLIDIDYFAAKAMQAKIEMSDGYCLDHSEINEIANFAYDMAEAMIRERCNRGK